MTANLATRVVVWPRCLLFKSPKINSRPRAQKDAREGREPHARTAKKIIFSSRVKIDTRIGGYELFRIRDELSKIQEREGSSQERHGEIIVMTKKTRLINREKF